MEEDRRSGVGGGDLVWGEEILSWGRRNVVACQVVALFIARSHKAPYISSCVLLMYAVCV
jgi:hypothetical protein